MTEVRIPLYKTQNSVGDEILPGIQEVLRSGWLTLGPKTRSFEEGFAKATGTRRAVATSNCTTALYLIYEALGIGLGDKVIVPAITFSATANVVRWRGAEPVFCDVDDDCNLDPAALRKLLEATDGIKAVCPVHLYGLPADMDPILKLAAKHDLRVVEDCAHSPGATYKGREVGSLGDAGAFSFYATKNMTTGEGGMITTNRDDVADDALKARSHRQTKDPAQKMTTFGYDVDGLGYNFRMSEFSAAIGLSQLQRLPRLNEERKAVAKRYGKALHGIRGLLLPREPRGREHVHHLYVVRFTGGPAVRNAAFEALQDQGILAGMHYPALHQLSYYRGQESTTPRPLPAAERLAGEILSLPFFPGLSQAEADTVASVLKGVVNA